jgi:hypothetical protein
MFAVGVGCAGLYGYAGVKASQAMNYRKTASQLEKGVNNPIPKQEDQTAYVAMKCMGASQTSSWFPTDKEVLVGRFFFAKATHGLDPVVNVTNSVCLPQELYLTCDSQEVIVHHLDLADWDGSKKTVTTLHSPEDISILLKEFNIEADLATKYKLKAEWFEGNQLTIFAQATRIENRLYLRQPQNDDPFIVTTEEPSAYAASIRSRSMRLQNQATTGALLAMIGSTTLAYQIQRKHGNAKAMYACLAVCALTVPLLKS